MKNQKNIKTILMLVMMICITLCAIWMIIDMSGETTSWFLDSKDGKLTLDWKYAGPYFALMLIALGTYVARTLMYTLKMDKNQIPLIVCEGIIGLGIVMAIIALFLPCGVKETLYPYALYENDRMTAGVIMAWLGMPTALVSGIARIFLSTRSSK